MSEPVGTYVTGQLSGPLCRNCGAEKPHTEIVTPGAVSRTMQNLGLNPTASNESLRVLRCETCGLLTWFLD